MKSAYFIPRIRSRYLLRLLNYSGSPKLKDNNLKTPRIYPVVEK